MGGNSLSATYVKKGEYFLITEGEYSDYHPTDLFVALTGFDLNEFKVEGKYGVDTDASCAAMIREEVAVPVAYKEFNASYLAKGKWIYMND